MRLSASRISMIVDRCAKQFEWRYVKEIIAPPGHALVLGGAVHKGAEVDNHTKLALGEQAPEDVVLDAYSDEFEKRSKNEDGPPVEWEDNDPGKLKDLGVEITRAYHKALSPRIKPVAVERRFEVEVAPHVTLLGYLDVEDEAGRVRDLKTAGKMKYQAQVDRDTQMSVYAYARELEGNPATEVVMDVVTKAAKPKTGTFVARQATAEMGKRRTQAALAVIESGLFPPHVGGWWCSQRFCGWWSRCPYGGGK